MALRVSEVDENSIGAELGVAPGDWLLSIDGERVVDYLDYLALTAGDSFTMVFRREGQELEAEVEKDDGEDMGAVALQGVWCIGIPDNAPHKELALELLEYVMSPEVQLASIENNGVPCRYSCLTDSTVLETYPHLQTVCGALETGVYRPVIEEWTEFTNILGTEMDNIIQGTKTMDEALAYAQEQLEQLMA